MDWSAVAHLMVEQAGLAVVLLDARWQLQLLAPAAQQALGAGSASVGVDWVESQVMPGAVGSARFYLDKALSGALRRLELPLRTADGYGMAHFEARPVGRDQHAGLLLVLERIVPLAREAISSDYDYEVSGVASGELRLTQLLRPGQQARSVEGRCFEVLHGRSTTCEQCPLVRAGAPRGDVIVSPRPPHDYTVTTFTRKGDDGARASVRSLTMASLAAIFQAKLDELALRARLSKRERSVFGYLMDGRAVDDIASELSISPRTVKFHQANVLQKLGADSRTDLMRLVF